MSGKGPLRGSLTPGKKTTRRSSITISGGAALSLGFALAPSLEAATFTVTNLDDAGAGSLRQAVLDANAAPGADIIDFQPGLTGTVTLTTGEIGIVDPVDVQGPGATDLTVSGNNSSLIFYIDATTADVTISGLTLSEGAGSLGGAIYLYGNTGSLTLENVTISGNASSAGGGLAAVYAPLTIRNSIITNNYAFVGGGLVAAYAPVTIENTTISGNTALALGGAAFSIYADLTVTDSTVSGNAADAGGGLAAYASPSFTIERTTISGNTAAAEGGGIFQYYADGEIIDSTISDNTAGTGGGLAAYYSPPFTIERTTISGNTAADVGGGIYQRYADGEITNSTISGNTAGTTGGGMYTYGYYSGPTNIRHSTIASNQAGTSGGGIDLVDGIVLLENSIVADNAAPSDNDLRGFTFDLAFSLVEDPGTAIINDNGGNIFNQDPILGPLADNAGPTLTHLPGLGSPVIDAGDPVFTGPPATDQRGLQRVVNSVVDMGAVEVGAAGTVEFAIIAVSVDESAGTVTLTVDRTGSTTGAISVDFVTSDGTALTPGDYTMSAGTLNWADGDATPQTIVVPIVDDLVDEPAETFIVTLSNPTGGAMLGANTVTTVTINASDAPVVPIPTLGFWGRIMMLLGAAWVGVWTLGRRLFGILLLATLASFISVHADAATPQSKLQPSREGKGPHPGVVTQIESVQIDEDRVTLKLANGTEVTAPIVNLWIRDYRTASLTKMEEGAKATRGRGHGRKSVFERPSDVLPTIAAGQPAIVKARVNRRTGKTRRVVLQLFDSLEDAQQALEAGKK
jgi:hypothetical protein